MREASSEPSGFTFAALIAMLAPGLSSLRLADHVGNDGGVRADDDALLAALVGHPQHLAVDAATVVSTVALVMVEPGRVHGRWPSPVPRCTSAKIITRIAFWLPSACGIAPTPMKAPGLMSASVARTTPNTPTLSVS